MAGDHYNLAHIAGDNSEAGIVVAATFSGNTTTMYGVVNIGGIKSREWNSNIFWRSHGIYEISIRYA